MESGRCGQAHAATVRGSGASRVSAEPACGLAPSAILCGEVGGAVPARVPRALGAWGPRPHRRAQGGGVGRMPVPVQARRSGGPGALPWHVTFARMSNVLDFC